MTTDGLQVYEHLPDDDAQEQFLKAQVISHIGVELEKLTNLSTRQLFELFRGQGLEDITFEQLTSILKKLAGLNNLGATFRE